MTESRAHHETCSFCRRSRAEVRQLVASELHSICDECVALCVEILDAHRAEVRQPLPVARLRLGAWHRWFRRAR